LERACEERVVGGGARPGAHLGIKLGPTLTATLAFCFIVLRHGALCCVLAVWVSVSVVTVLVSMVVVFVVAAEDLGHLGSWQIARRSTMHAEHYYGLHPCWLLCLAVVAMALSVSIPATRKFSIKWWVGQASDRGLGLRK